MYWQDTGTTILLSSTCRFFEQINEQGRDTHYPAIATLQAALAQQGAEDGIKDLGTDTLPGHALQAQQAAARRIPPKQRGLVLVAQGLQQTFEGTERALQTIQQIIP